MFIPRYPKMFSSIAAFFFGSSTSTPAPTHPTLSNEDQIYNSTSNIKEEVMGDTMIADGIDDRSPTIENILSTSLLSDEEAGWVFVNNHKRANSLDSVEPDKQEADQYENNSCVERSEMKPLSVSTISSATRSKGIPNSALHASSVLSALAEIRPHQKSERRQRERHLKRRQMERSNKAMLESSSSNRPSKRRSLYSSAVFSRAVNNRKH